MKAALAAAVFVLIAIFSAAGPTPKGIEREEIRIGEARCEPIRTKSESIIDKTAKAIWAKADILRRKQNAAGQSEGTSYGAGSRDIGSDEYDEQNDVPAEENAADHGAGPEGVEEDFREDIDQEQNLDPEELAQETEELDQDWFEPATNPEEPELIYLGTWTATGYCACPECCGSFSSGYTASGTLATEGRTIACNSLPIGTVVSVDGNTYVVEDTGWSPYGENWIDIFFADHDSALAYGMRTVDVYLIG